MPRKNVLLTGRGDGAYHVGFSFVDIVHHGPVVFSRLHAEQLIAGGPAVLQGLLPRLVLPHKKQVFPQADEGKTGVAVLRGHLFGCRRNAHTVSAFFGFS